MTAGARRGGALFLLVTLLLASAAARLWAIERPWLSHPDEVIATGVAAHLRAAGTLDTNWRNARLPGVFDTPQYNFSGYLIALAGYDAALALAGEPSAAQRLERARVFSIVFACLSLVVVGAIAASLAPGNLAAIGAATALAALSPSLFFESLYARPDAFATFLALLALLAFTARAALGPRWLPIASALVGFLVAVKISFAALYLLLLPGFVTLSPASVRWRSAAIAHLALLAGFALGAPAALLHPGDYAAGVVALSRQYTGDFPPHGLGVAASVSERLLHAAKWLAQTWGPAALLALLGAWRLARSGERPSLLGWIPLVLLLFYFSSLPVFFERNVTPSLMALAPLAGVGAASAIGFAAARRPIAAGLVAGLAALAIAVPLRADLRIRDALAHRRDATADRRQVEARTGLPVAVLGWARPAPPLPAEPRLVEVYHAGDAASRQWLDALRAAGWVEAGRRESAFADFVPSSFHTYLSEGVVWLSR